MKNIIIILLFVSLSGYSQYRISGKLVNENKFPVENAEIIIQALNFVDLNYELTNKNGEFTLSNIDKGNYKLIVRYFSENIYSQNISIDSNLLLETIVINVGISLKDVIIEAKKPLIENKVDRLVFNVENSISVAGGNALDALKLTPRIKIQNDEISMIGKGSMIVMINDKLLQFSGEELANYLKTINANDLKK